MELDRRFLSCLRLKPQLEKIKNKQPQMEECVEKWNAERVERGAGAEDPVGEPHEEVEEEVKKAHEEVEEPHEEVESASGRLKHNG